jgi:hypothetical protein
VSRLSSERAERLESDGGMTPLNWLLEKISVLIFGNLSPISAGIVPDSIFSPTSKTFSEDKLYKECGSSPESLLPEFKELQASDIS